MIVMTEKACFDDVEEILSVINTSNREAYRNIIPEEHFRESILSLEKLLEDFSEFVPNDRPECPPGYHLENLRERKTMGTEAWLALQRTKWKDQ